MAWSLHAALARLVVPLAALNVVVASTLMSLGLYRLWRHRHPRFGGMQVGFRDLTIWSFLMASAHGAGFMVLPFVMPMAAAVAVGRRPYMASPGRGSGGRRRRRGRLHTAAYFTVMALVAWVVYRKLGLNLLRKAWFNLDWPWAGALVLTGMVVLLK